MQSLGILASIPAAVLIVSLFFLLLYLLTRCCDRKSKKQRKFGCQKCTLIFMTILCCGSIGGGKWQIYEVQLDNTKIWYNFLNKYSLVLGLYGNDDLHNGLVQVFQSGKQLNRLFISVRNQVTIGTIKTFSVGFIQAGYSEHTIVFHFLRTHL